jgi:hypothetical protein
MTNRPLINLGRLKLGKTYRRSGSVGNGEVDVFRFKIADPGFNALTLNSRSSGSLEFVSLTDRQGKFPGGIRSSATVSSSSNGSEGQITNAFSGVAPGVYFLRIKGAGNGENTYSFRLTYEPNASRSSGISSSFASTSSSSSGAAFSSSSSSSSLFS